MRRRSRYGPLVAEVQLKPEQKARAAIDGMMEAADWAVQDYKHTAIDLAAARGVAVREFPTKRGPVDYLLFVDGKAIGTIEAKKEGTLLFGVEPQTERYIEGFAALVDEGTAPPHWERRLSFHYQSTGVAGYPAPRRARGGAESS